MARDTGGESGSEADQGEAAMHTIGRVLPTNQRQPGCAENQSIGTTFIGVIERDGNRGGLASQTRRRASGTSGRRTDRGKGSSAGNQGPRAVEALLAWVRAPNTRLGQQGNTEEGSGPSLIANAGHSPAAPAVLEIESVNISSYHIGFTDDTTSDNASRKRHRTAVVRLRKGQSAVWAYLNESRLLTFVNYCKLGVAKAYQPIFPRERRG